ncbi:MAG: hypothetical protein PHW46_05485, partial [Candidatus Omnitrophica bacterium]|nr:hypothetical protein [Candidatus Omnitrophota bacterium]
MRSGIQKYITLTAAILLIFATPNVFAADPVYTYYASGRIQTKEVDPEGTAGSVYFGKHVKYYYLDEIAHVDSATLSEYGRVSKIDLFETGVYWTFAYVNEADPTNEIVLYKEKRNLSTGTFLSREENFDDGTLRRITSETGNITEYLNENYDPGTGLQGYGRVSLFYKYSLTAPIYRTYDWSTNPSQVSVDEYEGVYSVSLGAAQNAGIIQSDRSASYVYDHNSEAIDLDPATNGWILRDKKVYDSDGLTLLEEYIYDASGLLTEERHIDENRLYTYAYYSSPNEKVVHYKYAYEISNPGVLIHTAEYGTDGELLRITYPGLNNDTIELYTDTGTDNWKRKIQTDGYIYEYKDEWLYGDKWNHYGRLILVFELDGYKTWTWDDVNGQVMVTEYDGEYTPKQNSVELSDVISKEKRVSILYDHKGIVNNLNILTNGWIEREKIVYDSDGVTVLEKYLRDESGRLMKEINTLTNKCTTYSYFTEAGMENIIKEKREYNYTEAQEAGILDGTVTGTLSAAYVFETYLDASGNIQSRLLRELHALGEGYHQALTYYSYEYYERADLQGNVLYKNTYSYTSGDEDAIINGSTTGTFIASYEYLDDDYMIKRDANGDISLLALDPVTKQSYTSSYYDAANGVTNIFSWDGSWNLVNIKKYYPNGNIETCTPEDPSDTTWPVTERKVASDTFYKGINLPWMDYGHDVGAADAS